MKKDNYCSIIFIFISLFIINACQKSEKTRVEDFLNEAFLFFSDTSYINKLKTDFAEKVKQINTIDNFDAKIRAIQDSINFSIETDLKKIAEKNGFTDFAEYEKILGNYKKDRYINILNDKLKFLRQNNSKELQKFSQFIIANKLKELTDKNFQDLMGQKKSNVNQDSTKNIE